MVSFTFFALSVVSVVAVDAEVVVDALLDTVVEVVGAATAAGVVAVVGAVMAVGVVAVVGAVVVVAVVASLGRARVDTVMNFLWILSGSAIFIIAASFSACGFTTQNPCQDQRVIDSTSLCGQVAPWFACASFEQIPLMSGFWA